MDAAGVENVTVQKEFVPYNQDVLKEIKLLRKELSDGLNLIFEHFKQEMQILQNDFKLEIASMKGEILSLLKSGRSDIAMATRNLENSYRSADDDESFAKVVTDNSNHFDICNVSSRICAKLIKNACTGTTQQLQDVAHIQSKLLEICNKQELPGVVGTSFTPEPQALNTATPHRQAPEVGVPKGPAELHHENLIALQAAGNLAVLEKQRTSDSVKCVLCSKEFPSQEDLVSHLRACHEEIFQNDRCNPFLESFIKFRRCAPTRDVVAKPFRCRMCGKTFAGKNAIRKHRQLHEKEKRFQCAVCSKGFAFQCDFTRHMRCHTGEKPFCCPTCGKCFKQKAHMQKHYELHDKALQNSRR